MMHRKRTPLLSFLLLLTLVLSVGLAAFADEREGQKNMAKVTTDTDLGWFDGNNIFSYLENDGTIVTDDFDGNSGMYWPGRASLKTINYCSGVWVAGKAGGAPVTACAEYASEWAPGMVLPSGLPDNKDDPKYKLYKINKADALDPQSNDDWMNWPVDQGAPWLDLYPAGAPDGVYEPLNGDMPDLLGDQMIWYVMNDLNSAKHSNVFSSAVIGLECRVTIWGYNRPDEFGDMMFAKFQLWNVGTTTVDSCYLGIWADVDLGDAADDFVGCDTTLSLGYTYNDGSDGFYGTGCPAIGYDFFQGALVTGAATDTGKAFGQKYPGMKNLGMNAFVKYIRGGGDAYGDPETAQQCWNYMSGLNRAGNFYTDPTTGLVAYPVKYGPGDPVTGTGWIDALDHPSGDRRQLQSCGPFTLVPGDSQEVVTACLIGQGSESLGSITVLKLADIKAQTAYDIDFELPPSPGAPILTATGLDKEVVLYWDSAQEDYEAEDKVDIVGGLPTFYEFQGYNVYQYEDAIGVGAWRRLATYDLVDLVQGITDFIFVPSLGEVVETTVQFGTDSGVQRYHIVDSDALRGNLPLENNRPYYFAVTAYGYNPDGIPKTLEGAPIITEVYPQQPFGQQMATHALDDTSIAVTHVGLSQGSVSVTVVDPSAVTGDDYEVTFYTKTTAKAGKKESPEFKAENIQAAADQIYWKLTNTTEATDVLVDQTYQGLDEQFTVADGILVKVSGPEAGLLAVVQVANHMYPEPMPTSEWDGSGTPYGGNNVWLNTISAPSDTVGAGGNGRYIFSYMGAYEGDLSSNHDFEIRYGDTTVAGTWSWGEWYFQHGTPISAADFGKCPFTLWDVGFGTYTDPSDDVQMMNVAYSDGGTVGQWNFDDGSVEQYYGAFPASDRIYFYYLDGPNNDLTYSDFHDAVQAGDYAGADGMWGWWYARPLQRIVYVNYSYYLGESPGGDAASGNVVRFITNKPNSAVDVFSFSTAGLDPTSSTAIQKADVDRINVFPNPYFGANVEETTGLEHFVRFTHLPDNATIRIFTLAGELIQTLEHNNGTQYEEWNLQNMASIPVASGMYIVHVDCGSLGEKVLKMAVIMPEERLRQY